MSDLLTGESFCQQRQSDCSAIKLLLDPVEKDLGGFSVRRFLPSKVLTHVGPFIFFDHMGPVDLPPGRGLDIRPHPHIGLATITYVIQGEILHRDSLGHVQPIRPNEINWMTAGKGIVHSERTGPELRAQGHSLEALQLWVALPVEDEECEPFFIHYQDAALPLVELEKVRIRLLIGEAFGAKSGVRTHSPTLYAAVKLEKGGSLVLPDGIEERAVYILSGQVLIQGKTLSRYSFAQFDQTPGIELAAAEASELVIIGGTPLGQRTVWWNLVSSRKELIEKAKADWRHRKFPAVPGEHEYIPLPG